MPIRQLIIALTFASFALASVAQAPKWHDTLGKYQHLPPHLAVAGFTEALANDGLPDTMRIDMLVTAVNDWAQLEQTDSASAWAQRAYQKAQEQSDTLRTIYATLSLSWTLRDQSRLAEVLEKALEAEQLAKAIGNPSMQIYALNTVASVYFDLGNDSLNQHYLEQAIQLGRQHNVEPATVSALGNLAAIYVRQKQYQKAKPLIERVLALEKQIGNPDVGMQFLMYGFLIEIAKNQQEYARCLELNAICLEAARSIQLQERVLLYSVQEQYYRSKLGQPVQLGTLLDSLNTIQDARFPVDTRKDFLLKKISFNRHFGRYQDALHFREALSAFEDSVNTSDLRQRIAYYQERFNKQQNEREIASLENAQLIANLRAEQQQQRIWLLASALALLLLLLGATLWLVRRLTRTKAELQQLNAVKDRFFAIISHDLRNSITAFEGVGAVIDAHIKRERWERLTRLGRQLDSEAEQLNRFLNNLLEWALVQLKRMPVNPANVPLGDAVQEQLKLYSTQLEHKGVKPHVSVPAKLHTYIDPNALSMALRNVIGNAIKFSQPGGLLRIEATESEKGIALHIEDKGIGIPPDLLKALFSLDKRTTRKGTSNEAGTGIGLVLTREVLELNHASMQVESTEGSGTKVTFVLPTARA